MSDDKGVSLREMISEKLSLSPFRSHLSQHAVPSSLFCSHKDCGQISSLFAESEQYSWSCGFLAWILLGIMTVLIAGGVLIIIRCYLKFRQSKNIERNRKPLSPSHIVFFSTSNLNEENSG